VNAIALLLPLLASALDAPEDDGPLSPMLLGALFTLLIAAICIAAAIVIAISSAVLLGFGIVSSSALIGLLCQRLSSGLRALHYQVFALLGIPGGIGMLWIAARILGGHPSPRLLLVLGSIAGLCSGLVVAFLMDCATTLVRQRWLASPSRKQAAIDVPAK